MKYYVYVTNCSNHNFMRAHDTLESALAHCKSASEQHNTAILIKGTEIDWKKKVKSK